ncbi:hypothetical protein PVAP13_J683431 [Panicum virgatum]|nr:hypothetical protein PVAP13_J683431 [Panicum virgatum]
MRWAATVEVLLLSQRPHQGFREQPPGHGAPVDGEPLPDVPRQQMGGLHNHCHVQLERSQWPRMATHRYVVWWCRLTLLRACQRRERRRCVTSRAIASSFATTSPSINSRMIGVPHHVLPW